MSAASEHRAVFLLGPERIEMRSVAMPKPTSGELLVRIDAATTCGTDVKVFRRGGHPRMLKVPGPFGHELAGTVAATGGRIDGAGKRDWHVGDRVVVANSAPCADCSTCRSGRENLCPDLVYLNGAFAEYILLPRRFVERSTYEIPERLPSEIAAITEPLACVLHCVAAAGEVVRTAHSELVVFGAGPMGLLLIQVLAGLGHRLVGVDPNPARLELARAMGAEVALQVGRGGKQAAQVRGAASAGRFDVAIDATGVPEAWSDAVETVRPGGLALLFGGCAPGTTMTIDTHRLHYSEISVRGVYHYRPEEFSRALEMLAGGAIDPQVLLTQELPLAETEAGLRAMIDKEAIKVVIRP